MDQLATYKQSAKWLQNWCQSRAPYSDGPEAYQKTRSRDSSGRSFVTSTKSNRVCYTTLAGENVRLKLGVLPAVHWPHTRQQQIRGRTGTFIVVKPGRDLRSDTAKQLPAGVRLLW